METSTHAFQLLIPTLLFVRFIYMVMVYSWPRSYKTFSMLNSAEHERLNAHKYKKYGVAISS